MHSRQSPLHAVVPILQENHEESHIVTDLDTLLREAIQCKASDIHFEPFENHFRIRYRIDGVLTEKDTRKPHFAQRITARIKVLAGLDIAERRLPQDGRFRISLEENHCIDFRVSICPTIHGEKTVIRILDPNAMQPKIDQVGLNEKQKKCFLKHLHQPHGIILVTGPTGSGKSITLYAALQYLNTQQVNILTVEDPIEMQILGVNQVQVNPKTGLNFNNTLRAFLRQDPDIIMLGEIRDSDTADIAIKAAQTGHLVLSTLHTNSAVEAITRLIHMGVPAFHLANSIQLIIAQRLIRVLCESCKSQRFDIPDETLLQYGFSARELPSLVLYQANGCPLCQHGYRGRTGAFEILTLNKKQRALLLTEGNSDAIETIAYQDGMLSLYQSGIEKMRNGITTIEEVNRVLGNHEQHA